MGRTLVELSFPTRKKSLTKADRLEGLMISASKRRSMISLCSGEGREWSFPAECGVLTQIGIPFFHFWKMGPNGKTALNCATELLLGKYLSRVGWFGMGVGACD